MESNADIRNMFKNALILFIITLVSGLVLGFFYELTKDPIRRQQELAIQRACRAVFENAAQFSVVSYTPTEGLKAELAADGVSVGSTYAALDSEHHHLGYVVEMTSSEGYGGDITLYLGIAEDGKINGISILEIAETPGLGMKADEILTPQFAHKQVESFTYTKSGSTSASEIDAISGATVTTKAIVNAVNGGLKVFLQELKDMELNIAVSGEGGSSK